MIRFYGFINQNVWRYLKKNFWINAIEADLIILLLFGTPSVLAGIYFDVWLFLGMVILSCLLMFFVSYSIVKENIPRNIQIDGREISMEIGNGFAVRKIEDVKKIIDRGGFYEIIFYFPQKAYNCICQKDLIVEGSIEVFEELFADYIVRKPFKDKN